MHLSFQTPRAGTNEPRKSIPRSPPPPIPIASPAATPNRMATPSPSRGMSSIPTSLHPNKPSPTPAPPPFSMTSSLDRLSTVASSDSEASSSATETALAGDVGRPVSVTMALHCAPVATSYGRSSERNWAIAKSVAEARGGRARGGRMAGGGAGS